MLLTEAWEDILYIISEFERACGRMRLKINVNKTILLVNIE